jgi:hypothetical protein
MKPNPSECLNQVCPESDRWFRAGREANNHKASFIKRRLFFSFFRNSKPEGEAFYIQLCYKGMK